MRAARRTVVAVIAVLAAAVATLGGLFGAGVIGPGGSAPAGLPTARPAPAVRFPSPAAVHVPAALPAVDVATPAGVAAAVRAALRDPALGGSVATEVADARGRVLYAAAADRPVIPASTTKLLTAAAALTAMPPTARLVTRVVAGAGPRQVVLVGGGDPTLASRVPPGTYPVPATVGRLAARTAAALRAAGIVGRVRVGYDASAYAGGPLGPGWKPSYVGEGDVAPVTALEVDEGRARPDARPRVTDPAALAARDFAVALRRAGVRVSGDPVPAAAPAAARELARVESPPIGDLVERMLTDSDNDLAEALGRRLALDSGRPPTFAGAAAAVLATLRSAGLASLVGVRLVDTSGLSRADRVTPAVLVALVRAALDRARLRPILTGLPVAGLTGTLADRFTRGTRSAAGAVRAKTGTLTHVSAVAGTTVDRSGELLVFAFVANRVPSPDPTAAEAALDRLTAVLAACGCG